MLVALSLAAGVVAMDGRLARAAAPTVTASLVRATDTSRWTPASPDPSGIVYLPSRDRLEVTDSEVDETTGAGYRGVNLWQLERSTHEVVDVGTTWDPIGFSKEPTGLGYVAASDTLLVSDDSARRVWLLRPGADGRFGTADDTRTFIDVGAYGSDDTEDPEYLNGHVYVLDGRGNEIYDVRGGADGRFGTADDAVSRLDIGGLGPDDWEGLSSDPATGHLLVGARAERTIYEITTGGDLVRIIDASGIAGMRVLSGLAYAPSSTGRGWSYWIVDRQVDNGRDPRENDGRLWEVSIETTDEPPRVAITGVASRGTTSPLRGTVTLSADVNDDIGVRRVRFFDGPVPIGSDRDGSDGWSVAWDTRPTTDGRHRVRVRAVDTAGNRTTVGARVRVDNTAPDLVEIRRPRPGTTVDRRVVVKARAHDAVGVTKVAFFVGSTRIGTDTDGSDGWSTRWRTRAFSEGRHRIRAKAWDAAGNRTASPRIVVWVAG